MATRERLRQLDSRRRSSKNCSSFHYPSLRRGESLFAEFDAIHLGALNRDLPAVLTEIETLHGGSPTDEVRQTHPRGGGYRSQRQLSSSSNVGNPLAAEDAGRLGLLVLQDAKLYCTRAGLGRRWRAVTGCAFSKHRGRSVARQMTYGCVVAVPHWRGLVASLCAFAFSVLKL